MRHHYLTIAQRERLEKRMRAELAPGAQLERALDRLRQPDYGVCIECGKDIGFVRLEVDPWALHCQACARLPISATKDQETQPRPAAERR